MGQSVCAEFMGHRIYHYRWAARRYRDDASEQLYHAEEARQTEDLAMERLHHECAASAARVAQVFDREAEELEQGCKAGPRE